jgi:hypothetical protein
MLSLVILLFVIVLTYLLRSIDTNSGRLCSVRSLAC